MSSRKPAWVAFAASKLWPLDPLEEALAHAAADVLASGCPASLDIEALRTHDQSCAAALVAIVEMARAVARGDLKTYKVVEA